MTASTEYDSNELAHYGRLNGTRGHGTWCPKSRKNRTEYLQVDMGTVRSVCAVETQGERGPIDGSHNDWTSSYKLQFSTDGETWNAYKENNAEKVKNSTE